MSRKEMRELEARYGELSEEVLDLRLQLSVYKQENRCLGQRLSAANCERDKYKALYTDEAQKRLELAEMARKLEEENRSLRGKLQEVLGE